MADGVCLCTIYDGRWTMYDLESSASEARGRRSWGDAEFESRAQESLESGGGGGGRESAYVRFTMDDVRFGKFGERSSREAELGRRGI